jgi:hypothetical protein
VRPVGQTAKFSKTKSGRFIVEKLKLHYLAALVDIPAISMPIARRWLDYIGKGEMLTNRDVIFYFSSGSNLSVPDLRLL